MNISSIITAVLISSALTLGLWFQVPEPELGTTNLIAGNTYNLSGAGVSSSATSITLSSLTIKQTGQKIQDSDLSDTFWITIEPGNNSKQEIVSCTTLAQGATTATLSGCTRGISPIRPYTASTTLQYTHGGGAQVIFSDPPSVFDEFAAKQNTAYITGTWGFQGTAPTSTTCATDFELCNKTYVDATANAGAATSTETNGGIVELATAIEAASSTDHGATKPIVRQAKHSTSTPTYGCDGTGTIGALCGVVALNSGKLNQLWLNLTEHFIFTSLFATAASSTNATSTNFAISSGIFGINGLNYRFPSTISASSTTLTSDATGNLTWMKPPVQILYSSNGRISGTVLATVALPSAGLGTQGKIRINCYCVTNGDVIMNLRIGTGAASTTFWTARNTGQYVFGFGMATSTNGQFWTMASTSQAVAINTESYYSNSAQLYIDLISASASSYAEGFVVELLNY